MEASAYYLAAQARDEAIRQVKDDLRVALRDVAESCSSSTSLGDAFRRLAEKLK